MTRFALPRLELVPCHRMPGRSFHFRGRPLPVCARCTGMLAGYATVPVFFLVDAPLSWFWAGLLLNLPAWVDGWTQALGWRESTNPLRLATGLASGVGQVMVVSALGRAAARLVLQTLGVIP